MNIDTFTQYFMSRNDIEWGDIFVQECDKFKDKFVPVIRHHLTEAGVYFTGLEIEQVTAKLWENLRTK